MEAFYKFKGDSVYITATSAGLAAGDIYISGNLIGAAKRDIDALEEGAISVKGIYDVAKTDDEVFSVGGYVYFDAVARTAYATSANSNCVSIGTAVKAAVADDETVRTLLG